MQVDSIFSALDSLKVPAALVAVGTYCFLKIRSLEKSLHEQNVAKEDKSVVEKLAGDVKIISMNARDASKKADQRFRVHELAIVALAPAEEKHDIIADLKGD